MLLFTLEMPTNDWLNQTMAISIILAIVWWNVSDPENRNVQQLLGATIILLKHIDSNISLV